MKGLIESNETFVNKILRLSSFEGGLELQIQHGLLREGTQLTVITSSGRLSCSSQFSIKVLNSLGFAKEIP
ncbi:hypothetical protein BWGOE4_19010 [Bacillus mycoides]|uniref:Uncharacterized protein n=1 Tax=Bacillus mycoides TaxID=1405 RepID=A0A1E8BQ23_BACMY|nr:hypothetical protein IEM_03464 [Bacillus cereus BAG6O-2]OFD44595.1 hypothetical protein BWGOE2_18560 [Bacillus mycoides]OFD47429.1 hypothetical protein BWGOE1_19090 [Bacillus mycoides]OFD50396.1 hypothetical protein BWGOE3_18550 [Bacillus mycoides]OFD62825.1 hypothetical protein BWGOE6_18880 [Bacillus mycoides]